MTVEYIMPAEAAVLLLAWLESRGAIATLDEDNFIHVDMDAITNFGKFTPEVSRRQSSAYATRSARF